MSSPLTAVRIPLAPAASRAVRIAGILLGGSALAAVCARLAIPLSFTPVPLTLAPFAVLLLGLVLSPRMAAGVFVAYLAEGALGLPVFASSPDSAGVVHLLGPTGGYLMAYPLAAALISWLRGRLGRGFAAAVFCAAAGDLLILACGALWLAALPLLGAHPAAALAVLPFLPGDALKVLAAAGLAGGWSSLRRRPADAHPK